MDPTFELDDVRTFIRANFKETDEDMTNKDIEFGYLVANSGKWPNLVALSCAVIHIHKSRHDNQGGETLKVTVGSLSRSYRPMSGRAGSSYWSSTEYGRLAMMLVRNNPVIAAVTSDDE